MQRTTAARAPTDEGMGRAAQRYRSLDGLRGVAALVVVVFHVLITEPGLDDGSDPSGHKPSGVSWWLRHTPLRLVWLGPEAVYVFFVLSGFVLVMPALDRGLELRSYYAKRLVRLYVPVVASVLFAWVLTAAISPQASPMVSEWYANHAGDVTVAGAVRTAMLIFGTGWLNSALWSLRWEVVFSLLLPVYLLGTRLAPRSGAAKLVLLIATVGVADALGVVSVFYLAMFGLGAVLANERQGMADAAERLRSRPSRWVALAIGAGLLLTSRHLLVGITPLSDAVLAGTRTLQLIGACLTLFLALHWAPARHRLSEGALHWLGTRSFSLYLVHEPIVVAVATVVPRLHVGGRLAITVPVSLVVAQLFSYAVERPSHRLATTAGRRAARCRPAARSRPNLPLRECCAGPSGKVRSAIERRN